VKRFVESEDDPAIRKIALREIRLLKVSGNCLEIPQKSWVSERLIGLLIRTFDKNINITFLRLQKPTLQIYN